MYSAKSSLEAPTEVLAFSMVDSLSKLFTFIQIASNEFLEVYF